MSESQSHSRAKAKAAGTAGNTEVRLTGNRRLDAATFGRATEIERSGRDANLEAAARRLRASGRRQKVLQVPNKDMGKAAAAMRRAGVGGTVKNMGGTRKRSIPKK